MTDNQPGILKRIILAVDGSQNAGRAVDFAAELAQCFPSRIIVLSVYKHRTYQESSLSLVRAGWRAYSPDEAMEELCHEAVQWAEQRLKDAGIKASRFETKVRRGPPARTIVRTAKQHRADTIVLGNRGLGDMEGFFLGSVSHKVNSLANCTCITVR